MIIIGMTDLAAFGKNARNEDGERKSFGDARSGNGTITEAVIGTMGTDTTVMGDLTDPTNRAHNKPTKLTPVGFVGQ